MTAILCLHPLLLRSSTTPEPAHTEQFIDGCEDLHCDTQGMSVMWVDTRTSNSLSVSVANVEAERSVCRDDKCLHGPNVSLSAIARLA